MVTSTLRRPTCCNPLNPAEPRCILGCTPVHSRLHPHASQADEMGVRDSVNGLSWLVRDGASVAARDAAVRAHTTVGVDRGGSLLILEVDGCEEAGFGASVYVCIPMLTECTARTVGGWLQVKASGFALPRAACSGCTTARDHTPHHTHTHRI